VEQQHAQLLTQNHTPNKINSKRKNKSKMNIQFDSIEIINFSNNNSTARRSSISVDEFELRRSIREQEQEENPFFESIVFNRMSISSTESSSPMQLPERQKSDDLLEFFGGDPPGHQPLKKRPERRTRLKGQPVPSQPLVLPARSERADSSKWIG
jgi:hypothetical protein